MAFWVSDDSEMLEESAPDSTATAMSEIDSKATRTDEIIISFFIILVFFLYLSGRIEDKIKDPKKILLNFS